ncbi:Cucumisin [Morella rubra]|uniref:Cucumisin n=1 Tax=Morella rubra TaxID=262757 RepID=A0A6A1WPU1_9ROSI|nr:Cucumisin [Morella rubra]
MAEVSSWKSYSVIFHRTVTNVGVSNSAYKAKIFMNPGMNIKVNPKVLYFKSLNEKKSFIVSVTGRDLPDIARKLDILFKDLQLPQSLRRKPVSSDVICPAIFEEISPYLDFHSISMWPGSS